MIAPLLLPRILGHRGAAASAPENTLAGFRRAKSEGAAWVEFDAKLSADNAVILLHDDDLDRTTDGKGPVARASLAALKTLDAGSWFAPAFAGERIPTLAEALALFAALDLDFNLEIKPCPGRDRETAEIVMRELQDRLAADRRLRIPLVSSFSELALEVARDIAPKIPRGLLLEDRPADWAARAQRLAATTINIWDETADPDWIAAMKADGYGVLVYTVNAPERGRRLLAWGADGVFTDRPGALLAELG